MFLLLFLLDHFYQDELADYFVSHDVKQKLDYTMKIGTVYVFKGLSLNQEACLILMTLGKNAKNLQLETTNSHKILFPPLITQDLFKTPRDLSILFNDLPTLLKNIKVRINE